VQDLTAAELNAFFYGDSTSSTAAKFAAYQFTGMENIAATFPAGTLIVAAGPTAGVTEDTSYDPDNGDWNIELVFGSPFITKQGANSGDFAATDVAWVDTVSTGDTLTADGFAVNWDSTPGVFGANASLTVPAPINNANLYVAGGDHFDPLSWASAGTSTPGEPNGGANTDYIDELRRGEVLLIELESFSASAAGVGSPVSIEWTTSSEIDCVGFRVRRVSTSGLGGFVSDSLIPAEGTNGGGSTYDLVDPLPVQAGENRGYVLVEIDANGTVSRFGPFWATVGGDPSSVSEWSLY
jgi:hypothetical protein